MTQKHHQCIFRNRMIFDEVNPRLAKIDPKTPYGAFQRIWRQTHCTAINPYDSAFCPYRQEECVVAYWKTATDALTQASTSPIGLFKILAQRRGFDRAENKPLMRDRDEASAGGQGDPEGSRVHRSSSGPIKLGSVLGEMDLGAREPREHSGKAGS